MHDAIVLAAASVERSGPGREFDVDGFREAAGPRLDLPEDPFVPTLPACGFHRLQGFRTARPIATARTEQSLLKTPRPTDPFLRIE